MRTGSPRVATRTRTESRGSVEPNKRCRCAAVMGHSCSRFLQSVWGRTTSVADWIHRRVDSDVVRSKSAVVAATKSGQQDLVTP